MRRIALLMLVVALVAAACTSGDEVLTVEAQPEASDEQSSGTSDDAGDIDAQRTFAGTEPAPEFPTGLDWLNTDGPLSFEQLAGKVVLLDFWTYGCINCIHIIPDLKRLESEYPEELVVIGVHSAKFVNEGETENIRQTILRYGLEHPVVNDRDFAVWQAWGAQAWPTVVLVDPAGNVVGGHSGEGVYGVVAPVIASLVAEFDGDGRLSRDPVPVALESEGLPDTVLSYPGKVLATDSSLYIADTNHNRIVVADRETGDVTALYGSGTAGFADGLARSARFRAPQGLALSPDASTLYVADTNNHSIRAVDLGSGEVTTLTGTGRQATWPPTGGIGPNVPLTSPWDVELGPDGILYIAMAGTHQIWAYDTTTDIVGPLVGSAREGTRNGPLADAELAQPSGLALSEQGRLYFADSESSAIRWADVGGGDALTGTLAGSDTDLFSFGDIDGIGTAARLQHPLGVALAADGFLYVADTYNSKIKRLDVASGEATTYAGGDAGWADGTASRFYEPSGLSAIGDLLYVADTNNHAIRVIDLANGAAETLVLKGIERFIPPPDDADYGGVLVALDPVHVAPGPGALELAIALPAGYKVNEEAPSSVTWTVTGDAASLPVDADRSLTGVEFPVTIPVEFTDGTGALDADLTVIYCAEETQDLCLIQQLRFNVPITVAEGTASSVQLPYEIVLPEL